MQTSSWITLVVGILAGSGAHAAPAVTHTLLKRFPDSQAVELTLRHADRQALVSCTATVSAKILVSPSGAPNDPSAYELGTTLLPATVEAVGAGAPRSVVLGEAELQQVQQQSGALGYFYLDQPTLSSISCDASRSFTSYCEDPAPAPGQRGFVEALLALAGTHDCMAAQVALINRKTLDLVVEEPQGYPEWSYGALLAFPLVEELALGADGTYEDGVPSSVPDQLAGTLEQLKHLRRLRLVNPSDDLRYIKKLRNLTALAVVQPRENWGLIVDVLSLVNLESLTLDFRGAWVDDYGLGIGELPPLSGLSRLRQLTIKGVAFGNLEAVSQNTNLKALTVHHAFLDDLWAVSPLRGLEYLDVMKSGIGELSGLRGLPALKTVRLRENGITNVAPLTSLSALEYLDVEANWQGGGTLSLGPLGDLRETVQVHAVRGNSVPKSEAHCPTLRGPQSLRRDCARHLESP
jgi:hypothetical protein